MSLSWRPATFNAGLRDEGLLDLNLIWRSTTRVGVKLSTPEDPTVPKQPPAGFYKNMVNLCSAGARVRVPRPSDP